MAGHDRRSSCKDSMAPSRLPLGVSYEAPLEPRMEGVAEVPRDRRQETAEKLQRALVKGQVLRCLALNLEISVTKKVFLHYFSHVLMAALAFQ